MLTRHPLTRAEVAAPVSEWLPGCVFLRCPKTGLEWLHPAGEEVFPDFAGWAEEMHRAGEAGTFASMTPPFERAALAWTRQYVPPGAEIVELFAETGRFAWQLRRGGYRPLLADPLGSHVSMLNRHGFEARQARTPEELPAGWINPAAVFILESLVRLQDPLRLLDAVRNRFPNALLYVTVPSPRRPLKLPDNHFRSGYPPDFKTRWTLPALRLAVAQAGYDVRARTITPGLITAVPPARWKRRLFNVAVNALLWVNRELEFSYAAWGRPRSRPCN